MRVMVEVFIYFPLVLVHANLFGQSWAYGPFLILIFLVSLHFCFIIRGSVSRPVTAFPSKSDFPLFFFPKVCVYFFFGTRDKQLQMIYCCPKPLASHRRLYYDFV